MTLSIPAIETRGLSVAYGATKVLQSINLSIPQQTVMGLVGPNGAGKSTLLKSILSLIPKTAGEVSVLGKPFCVTRKLVGYIPQRNTIDWDFPISVRDLVTMGTYGRLGWFRRPRKKERLQVDAALDRLGIAEYSHRQIGNLSGGQQQRAFLARAFVQDAPIYFLDEPFNGVDATTEATIVELLHEMRDQGKTIIVVQHDLKTACQYLDEVTFINGTVIATGPVDSTFTETNAKATYNAL